MGMTRVRLLTAMVGLVAIAGMAVGASGATAPCRPGPAAKCAGADLDGARLAKKNLSGATFSRASLVGARLQAANLSRANLTRANLTRANLTGADLRGANLARARLRNAILRKARLGRTNPPAGRRAGIARGCLVCTGDLRGADLRDADLGEAVITRADLRGANLSGARVRGAVLVHADLRDANLDGADLGNTTIQSSDLRGASLVGANLSGAHLGGAVDLRGANLTGADLRGTNLSNVTFGPGDLTGANLEGATLPPSRAARTTVSSGRSFTAKVASEGVDVSCTGTTECSGWFALNAETTLTVTTSWAGIALCPDGPVRLTTSDGGTTYAGTCTYTGAPGVTIRIRETRRITVTVKDLIGDPATIDRISLQWREPTSYDLVEAEHVCTGVTTCVGDYAEGSRVKVVITGSGPYHTPITNSCRGGAATGESTMVSAPPWELTCLVDDDGHPLQLTADRELVLTLS